MTRLPDEMPLAEWQAEMERRGKLDCRFVCPSCGHEASPNDWKGLDGNPQRAPQECIGRLVRAVGSDEHGCNWAAFGLIDICKRHIIMPDGKRAPVFLFAGEESS